MEEAAARRRPRSKRPTSPASEALAMLARRGLRPYRTSPDLPFPHDLAGEAADRLVALLDHYAFRLFLRGAILRPEGFPPEEASRYLPAARARMFADSLVELGLAVREPGGRVRLLSRAASFGGTLEWYVGRELGRWLGLDVVTGVKFHSSGFGGDLDIVASCEGKLLYVELKSSPPKHLSDGEVTAFFERVDLLRCDVALFAVDTALRLADKVVPMLVEGLAQVTGTTACTPRRIERELWVLSPHVYVVNGKPDLLRNIGRAIAEGLRARSPDLRAGGYAAADWCRGAKRHGRAISACSR
jgi:hypothetical protein